VGSEVVAVAVAVSAAGPGHGRGLGPGHRHGRAVTDTARVTGPGVQYVATVVPASPDQVSDDSRKSEIGVKAEKGMGWLVHHNQIIFCIYIRFRASAPQSWPQSSHSMSTD
jgi:hypothetical protein